MAKTEQNRTGGASASAAASSATAAAARVAAAAASATATAAAGKVASVDKFESHLLISLPVASSTMLQLPYQAVSFSVKRRDDGFFKTDLLSVGSISILGPLTIQNFPRRKVTRFDLAFAKV